MMKSSAAALGLVFFAAGLPSHAAEPATCSIVRMAQPGWNDLLFTHSVAAQLLTALGYKTENAMLGLNIIFKSLEKKDLDVFLGMWDPQMTPRFGKFRDDGTVETLAVNLTGAKYTYAVPTYVWEAGVKDLHDVHKYADRFDHKMYGIEPGTNVMMFNTIKDPEFELDGWTVVESSEQGMLAQVSRAIRRKEWILFQGWEPHPMNAKYDMKYLTGGDKFYGANMGAATVSSLARKGYAAECPNVAQLIKNLKFDVEMENAGIGYMTEDKMSPDAAARKAIINHPEKLGAWLAGVQTVDGGDGLTAVKKALALN